MRHRHARQWERVGAADPYWGVLTDPARQGRAWSKDEFFETGEIEIDALFASLQSLDLDPPRDVGVDFGCGVGRLSRPLSKRFRHLIAVDVSSTMLAEARAANDHISNVTWMHNTGPHLEGILDESVSFVYSNITLQHMPRPSQRTFIAEFCRILRPGGVAVFQTPSHRRSQTWRQIGDNPLGHYLRSKVRTLRGTGHLDMEVYPLPRERVESELSKGGMAILRVEEYDVVSPLLMSYRYYASKSS